MITGRPSDVCTCAFGASSSASGLRWTPRMVADVEVVLVLVHLLLADVADPALVAIPTLACNIFQ